MSDGLSTPANTFQQLMLQWERFAPYNAGQFVTTDHHHGAAHVSRAFRQAIVSLGLQQIGQHPDTELIDTAESPDAFLSARMNEPFSARESPLRPFVLRDGAITHIGMIYRHVVADSASIRLVMRQWFSQIQSDGSVKPAFRPITPLRQRFAALWREQRWGLIREVLNETSRLSRLKHVRRLVDNDPRQPIAWRRIELDRGLSARLLRYARSKNVKVNDLFVAAAAVACDRHLPHEEADARRDLAIGTIVDTRQPGENVHGQFGLSLGVLQTVWRWQQLRDWDVTLATAAAASRAARQRQHAQASTLRLTAATWNGSRMTRTRLATFYRKRCPLSAGISNVNLTREWPAAHYPSPILSYTRVSPLGPMLPLVFTPTTLGDSMTLGFTYRTHVVPDAIAQRILDAFVQTIAQLG